MSISQDVLLKKALVLYVFSLSNEIKGRKKLQKMVYLINSLGWNAFSDYRLYLYGPYSDGLSYEILNLKEEGMLKEEISDKGYTYKLTKTGDDIYKILEKRISETQIKERTNDILKIIQEYTADKLELISTLVYINNKNPGLNRQNLKQEIMKIKPKYKAKEIENAMSEEIVNVFLINAK